MIAVSLSSSSDEEDSAGPITLTAEPVTPTGSVTPTASEASSPTFTPPSSRHVKERKVRSGGGDRFPVLEDARNDEANIGLSDDMDPSTKKQIKPKKRGRWEEEYLTRLDKKDETEV